MENPQDHYLLFGCMFGAIANIMAMVTDENGQGVFVGWILGIAITFSLLVLFCVINSFDPRCVNDPSSINFNCVFQMKTLYIAIGSILTGYVTLRYF